MLFTTEWLASIFEKYSGKGDSSLAINQVTTDSREKTEQSLFVPIVGEKLDGHDFAEQALDNGASAFLWDQTKSLPTSIPDDFPVFYVEDTLTALQQLASHYRDKVNPVVIGITGSNGKTTTKDLTASVISTSFLTHYTKGNFNNHIGLPLTILAMPPNTEVLIVEMGMSNFGEIEQLSFIAKPDYAIITNIGESHIEYLHSREGIAKAKMEIAEGMASEGRIIIDGDESLLNNMKQVLPTETCGFDEANDHVIKEVQVTESGTEFQILDEKYQIPLFGKHHAKNAAYAITLGKHLRIPTGKIQAGLASLKQTGMRFEMMKATNGATIVNDAYNASPTSMKAAIEVIKQMTGYSQKVLVLGDVLELGSHSEALHRSVAEVIDSSITAVFTYGKDAAFITDELSARNEQVHSVYFTDKQLLLESLRRYKDDSILLFKASRGLRFESFIEKLID